MGVFGVNLEPALDAVASVFGMGSLLPEVGVGHDVQKIASREAGRLKREKRMRDRPLVVQPGRELVLVVRPNRRVLFRDEQSQPDGRCHLAVGEVMHDFARGPFSRRRSGVELFIGRTLERGGHFAIAVLVFRDQCCARVAIHVISLVTVRLKPDTTGRAAANRGSVRLQADRQYNKNGSRVARKRSRSDAQLRAIVCTGTPDSTCCRSSLDPARMSIGSLVCSYS